MATQEKSAFATIQEFVKTIDFDTLIEVAEFAALIPAIGTICVVIIKILKFAKKFQPTASKVLVNADQLYGVVNNNQVVVNEAEEKINTLIEIALEDGVVTDDEANYILERAAVLGVDVDIVKLKLLSGNR
ncbi:MAG: hypothetical protein MJZ24_05935 [Paludibacteraceae bacterium]|nr:hypothetical protein [Paludibacteraceae bacterium]